MALAFYLDDDATLATTHTFTAAAGAASTAWTLHLWYNKGTGGGQASGIRLSIEVEDPNNPGTWLTSGHQALDKAEFLLEETGTANPGTDALFDNGAKPAARVGTDLPYTIGTLRGNTAAYVTVTYSPRLQSGSTSESFSWRLVATYNETTQPVPVGVMESCGNGILTGCGDSNVSEWVEAPTVTETGTPDDKANVSRRWWVMEGNPGRALAAAVTLNQTDGASGTLTVGQSYYAVLSQSAAGTITTTKGMRSATPTTPAMPAGELPIALVSVAYQAGGTSVITTADITETGADGRGKVSAVSGLNVSVAALRAIVGRALITRPSAETVAVTDNATTELALTPTGTIATSMAAGYLWLATVVASAGSVTTITDERRYVEPGAEWVRLAVSGTEASGTNKARAYVASPWALDRVVFAVRAPSTGATGATTADVNFGGTTVFTNQGGSVESRPKIAAQGTADTTAYPEVTTGNPGWLSLDVDTITSGGTQAVDLEAMCRIWPRC